MDYIKRINCAITAKYKLIIGFICLIAAVIIEVVTDFDFFYSDIISVITTIGMLSIACAAVSGIFKVNIPYIFYMPVNCIGFLCYMYTFSRSEEIGAAYTIIFSAIIFFALWIFEILLLNKKSPAAKIFGGLLVNFITVLMIAVGIFAITFVSIVLALE